MAFRAVAYAGVGDLIPLYALYAVLFADHGLSTAEISSLLFLWSLTAFVFEVPSGAWADLVSRRALLILGALLTAAGFAAWTVLPSYVGFAVGFVLWGVGGSLESGTFQALVYDNLAARSETARYPAIVGWAGSAEHAGSLIGILSAAPLFLAGGYPLVGWVSVAAVLARGALAASLPDAPKRLSVNDIEDVEDPSTPPGPPEPAGGRAFHRYLGLLKSGVTEAVRHPTVRGGVLLSSLLFGYTAFDEYFGLLAEENGAPTSMIPYLVGITVIGTLVGSVLAGRTAAMRPRTMAVAVIGAGITLGTGSLIGGPGVLGVVGFILIGVGYGTITNTVVVTEARLQDAITGPARATVTSVASLAAEVVSLVLFGAVALGSIWWSTPVLLAVLAVPVVATALLVRKWLPPGGSERSEPSTGTDAP